jgi:hypothetical protein
MQAGDRETAMRAIVFGLVAVLLAACGPYNSGLNTLQFSSETVPFPQNYQIEAARVAATRPHAPGVTLVVSRPQPTLGLNALSPQRWFVCIRGLASPAGPSRSWPKLDELVGQILDPAANPGNHDVILVFSGTARPTLRQGTDSPLCRTAVFEPLTAAAPLI